jgi:hypothetical protein
LYYSLEEDFDLGYEDVAGIEDEPQLPDGVNFRWGRRFSAELDLPLRIPLDTEWGKELTLTMGSGIPLWRDDLIATLHEVGVCNLDLYDAIIENPFTGEDVTNYKAVNIIGLVAAADVSKSSFRAFSDPPQIDTIFRKIVIDEDKTYGILLFRMAESLSEIIVHQKVKEALEKKFSVLEFIPAF